MKKSNKKLFVVRKYVWATSASQALLREKKQRPDDVWVDEDFKRNASNPKDAIGFNNEEE